MNRKHLVFVVIVLATFLLYPALVQSQTDGQAGPNDNRAGWYCPYCSGYMGPGYGGGYGMGPGMMRGYGGGYGMGPGMMGYGGGGYGPGYGSGPQYRPPAKPLNEKEAKAQVENYLKSTRNPNLKVGSVSDKGNAFEVDILTKNNSLANKILVDKNTGWMNPAY